METFFFSRLPIKITIKGVIFLSIILYISLLNLFFSNLEFRVLLAILLSIFLVTVASAFAPLPKLKIQRIFPFVKHAGEPFVYTLVVTFEGPVWVTRRFCMNDVLEQQRGIFRSEKKTFVVYAGEKEKQIKFSYTMKAPARGEALFSKVEIKGWNIPEFFSQTYSLLHIDQCLIFPERLNIDFTRLELCIGEEGEESHVLPLLQPMSDGDFEGVREYRPGDRLRLVDWKRRQRDHQQWWVKHYQIHIPQHLTVLFDPQGGKLISRHGLWLLDQAIAYLLSMCSHALLNHISLTLITIREDIEQFELNDYQRDIQRLNYYCAAFQSGRQKILATDIEKIILQHHHSLIVLCVHDDALFKYQKYQIKYLISPDTILKHKTLRRYAS